ILAESFSFQIARRKKAIAPGRLRSGPSLSYHASVCPSVSVLCRANLNLVVCYHALVWQRQDSLGNRNQICFVLNMSPNTFVSKTEPGESNRIIQSLWIGSELSVMERMSIISFLRNGHEYHLYTYNDLPNVPDGTVIKDANGI